MNKLLFIATLALSGCASSPSDYFALMKNPKTGQVAQCKTAANDEYVPVLAKDEIDHCVKAYEKAGFIRIDEENSSKK